ncbi:MAG: kinase to dihydroxyacetone kinase [Clostridiales bacterium]|nr:kinase to dihydroxyacetone kinase [Clostridiales bacterium]
MEFIFDTQMLIEGQNLSEDAVRDYITGNIAGDSLLVIGDETLLRIHFHTNMPWRVLEYAASLGDVHDIVIENMRRQAQGANG